MKKSLLDDRFVIVFSTNIATDAGYISLSQLMSEMAEIICSWTIDLLDNDKVLRVISSNNIAQKIKDKLDSSSIDSELMGILDRIDYSEIHYL